MSIFRALLASAGLGLLLGASAARAELAPLSWEDCIRETIANNPDLKAARANVEAARDSAASTRSAYFPSLSANLSGSNGQIPGSDLLSQSYSASISANESLFSGFSTRAAVRQAEANVRLQDAKLQATRANVSYNLKSAFAGLFFAQSSIRLSEEIIGRREENLKNVELRFENGTENKGSVLLSQAYVKDAKLAYSQALDARAVASRQLAQVLGRGGHSVNDLAGGDESLSVRGEVPITPPTTTVDLVALASATPSHLQALATEESADAAVTVARAGFFPTVGVSASVGRTGPTFFPDPSYWSVGFNITYPFFNSGRDYYATRAAANSLYSAAQTLESTDQGLLVSLRQALAAYTESAERLSVDTAYVSAATVREKIGRAKYYNGLLSFEDFDVIENDLINRQRNVLGSQRDRVTNEAAWEQALGKGVIP